MIRLAIRCAPELAEQVLAELVELAPSGVEQGEGIGPDSRPYTEYAIYGPPGEVPDLPDLKAAAGDGLIEVRTTEVADDWADRWRQFHHPIEIEGRIVVRPPWEEVPTSSSDAIEIVIDPGQAFGTGAHATTSMCLRLLLDLLDDGLSGQVADLGTGSGVLAIAAAKLGFGPVFGCDYATESIDAAAVNAGVNGVELEVGRLNLREQPGPSAPIWLANLTAPLLLEVVSRMDSVEPLPDELILSGMLTEEADLVAAALAERGYREVRRVGQGDWSALRMQLG